MNAQNVCVIGCGYVGLVTGACLAEIGHRVVCVDNDPAKIATLLEGKLPIYEPGLDVLVERNCREGHLSFSASIAEGMKGASVVFIAVGTPPQDDGSADLSFVESVAREIASHLEEYTVIAEKSTVPVETGEQVERTIHRYVRNMAPFDVVSNPEFLREGTAIEDFLHPDRIVIGVKSRRAEQVMRDLYEPLQAHILITDLKSAELIKHASNSFLATKISFINAVSRVCDLVGADVSLVAEGMGLDPRIGRSFLQAGVGFGGFCLPKDVEAFLYISGKVGYNFDLLRVVKQINEDQRSLFLKKIEEALWIVKDKTVAVLGIAFKPNTDDIRFAPALDIIARLQQKGARIKAYDPVAMHRARAVLEDVEFCEDLYKTIEGADCLVLMTEWPEFKELDFARVRESMTHPIIVDGRNALDPQRMRELGYEYYGVGR